MRRFHWYSNGSKRHASRTATGQEAVCGAVWSVTRSHWPLVCLACLHALGQEQQRPRDRAREWREDEAA